MNISFPHTIENGLGEKIIFKEIIKEPDGDKVIIEGFVTPGSGPPMHVHFMQDECFTIKSGKAGYQTAGGEQKFASEGETFLFKRGVMHRFWNAGETELVVNSWVKPAHSIVFFLSAVYAAQKKSGKHQPDQFDGAYLLTKYKSEYAMGDIPPFVRNVIIPITYQMGKMMGKYKKFKDAPEPVK